MQPLPCPLCGYDAPGATCPHCRLAPEDASLREPPGALAGILDGLVAMGHGLFLLATTRGVKRFLIPPLILTLGVFGFVFAWIWSWIDSFLDAVRIQDVSGLDLRWDWVENVIEWLIQRGVVLYLAQAGAWLVFLVSSSLVALWTFSIAYEAISGPFLDEIQGRIERRWFGRDPRDALARPNDISSRRCVLLSVPGGLVALTLLVVWWKVDSAWAWLAIAAAPTGFVLASVFDREYGQWLWWMVRLETHTTWVGIKASLLAGSLMVLFFWLRFVPLIGYFLFAGLTGFATAISLLDIPFSRRQWSVRQRLQFLAQNPLPTVAYGFVASLFFLVPFLGPLIAVPAASVGGMWLVCRLDKNRMRPKDRRMTRPTPPSNVG